MARMGTPNAGTVKLGLLWMPWPFIKSPQWTMIRHLTLLKIDSSYILLQKIPGTVTVPGIFFEGYLEMLKSQRIHNHNNILDVHISVVGHVASPLLIKRGFHAK